MLLSHEVPFSLLFESRKFNEYDYSLVHLFEEHSNYFDFFVDSLEMGRKVILDNSVFELEEAFDAKRFAYWIEKLKPTEYIIPDVLDNSSATIESCMDWIDEYYDLPGKTIGVIQGATVEDAIICYNSISLIVDKVAISFNCKFYSDLHPSDNKLESWMYGRQKFIDLLIEEGLTDINQKWHLLGCSYMAEFQKYKEPQYSFIESVDTSNPIVFALANIKCAANGLNEKVSTKLIEYIHTPRSEINMDLVNHNVSLFRSFVK